ncbi:hypothetical protein C9J12_08155 [Photobacterium frigidiphilum]|uniref:MarR family transcriptional regulator n=1 Tax=Photobacterium frigidiphilum TaxID=264736 RepID=A0A2T3JKA1_9GAMM|nr:hypothetical protein [Photobacterium frigidiphilum]PSU49452.1 hypothetical protein C9J12_08155 [Photobacterium frigidiphilum]
MGVKATYQSGNSKQKMWQSMRILGVFTPSDIAQTAEVSLNYASVFVGVLRRAGYLKKDPSKNGPFAMYRLLRNTGPHAPRHWTKERCVFDLNKAVVYVLD